MEENKNFLPPSDLAFDSIKENLKDFLRTKDRFKDIDFEGSNINLLIELLAFNTWNNAHYMNMVGTELAIDSAQLREVIVSHAKSLNYTPRSRVSSRARVRVQVFPTGNPISVTIPKHYIFKTTDAASNTLRFMTDQPITITRDGNDNYISKDITVFEGYIVNESFLVTSADISQQEGYVTYNRKFVLQSENVDISSIEVYVQDNESSQGVQYKRATSLLGVDDSSEIFFVRGHGSNHYEIEFGDGHLGKMLQPNNIIHIVYRDTIGELGNGLFTFTKTAAIDGYPLIEVQTLSRASGGAERESDDSIRYNAVRHYQAQDRAVIESDYEILIKTNFPEIQEVNVYGGERIYQYGKVFVVLKPYNLEGIVDDATKTRIVNFLKTKNLVPEPVIEDPEYFYLGVQANVYYDPNLTRDETPQIISDITEKLVRLNDTILSDFSVTVYESDINETLKKSHPSVVGTSSSINIIRRWFPQRGLRSSINIDIDNPIKLSGNENVPYSVTTNSFQVILNDVIETVIVRDDSRGNLFLHRVDDEGNLNRIIPSVGTVNYKTGEIKISLDVYDYNNSIDFTCIMENDDITVDLNKYLILDQSYVNISLKRK